MHINLKLNLNMNLNPHLSICKTVLNKIHNGHFRIYSFLRIRARWVHEFLDSDQRWNRCGFLTTDTSLSRQDLAERSIDDRAVDRRLTGLKFGLLPVPSLTRTQVSPDPGLGPGRLRWALLQMHTEHIKHQIAR
jgi:hypothetical protein